MHVRHPPAIFSNRGVRVRSVNHRCAKCDSEEKLTRHHVYPKRYVRRSSNTNQKPTVKKLCRDCHDVLERIITQWECKVTKLWEKYPEFYAWVVDAFLDTTDERSLEPPADLPLWSPVWAQETRTA